LPDGAASFIEQAPGWRKVSQSDRSDRIGHCPGPIAGGAKSLFPCCFSWQDRSIGPIGPIGPGLPADALPDRGTVHLLRLPHDAARQGRQPRLRSQRFDSLNNFKERIERFAEAAPLDRA